MSNQKSSLKEKQDAEHERLTKELSDTPQEPIVPPVVTQAFSMERMANGWSFLTYTFFDDQLKRIDRTEPDLKSITIEKFKIAAFKYWSTVGG